MSAKTQVARVSLMILSALALAGADSRLRPVKADAQHLEGSWKAVVTATDPPLLFTPGHGAWERTADDQFAATVVDFFQAAPNNPAADGTVLGEEEVRYRVTLDPSGENLNGQLIGEIKDSEGNVVFTFSANVRATRIH